MKALVLSDIHGDLQALKAIGERHLGRVEVVFLLGDLTNFGGAEETQAVLRRLEGKKAMGFAGNLDTGEVQSELERQGVSLHARKELLGEWTVAGFGGGLEGGPGRFLFGEEEIGKNLEEILQGAEKSILLTHLPPLGTGLDTASNGMHIGSRSVREVLEKGKLALHLCGHCHEAFGEEKVGGTTSINVGAVKEGRALLLEMGETLKWERIKV